MTKRISHHIFLITLFSFFSLHETFNMFFVGDDFGVVYKLQNSLSYAWPQHQIVNMFRPLYLIFGTNPTGYFSIGFVVFVLSATIFYFLARQIFSNESHALIAALIYTTAPIGIESVTMMLLYIGSYYALALFSLILIFFLKFLKTGKVRYQFLSMLVLLFTFETVAFRAFLFPLVMSIFGLFFWNRKKLGVKKLIVSYFILFFLWGIIFLFRSYLIEIKDGNYVTNLNLDIVITKFYAFKSRFINNFPGNGFYDGMTNALVRDISSDPKRVLGPIVGTVNIIFTIPYGKLIPLLHVPLLILIAAFSFIVITKREKIKDSNQYKYFAFIMFIFAAVLAFYIPFPKDIMPSDNHYSVYALPGYALLATSIFLILQSLLHKKIVSCIFLVLTISLNLYNTTHYLAKYNKRIIYVRPFFKQLKELQPTFPKTPFLVYIETIIGPDEDPSVIRWRLYDIWRGGIMGPNGLFGTYYKLDANKIIATPEWDTVKSFVRENSKNIDSVYGFSYSSHGLTRTTEEVRDRLKNLVATGEINF